MEKMAWDGPECGWEVLFPANPDIADILGDKDFDFENFHFCNLLYSKFLDFQVPRYLKSGLGRAGLGGSAVLGRGGGRRAPQHSTATGPPKAQARPDPGQI